MNIRYITPFNHIDKNIGKCYNEAISELPSDCWICLSDHDTLLFPGAGQLIPRIITDNPEYSLFTALTNRVGVHLHCVTGMFNEDSILAHQNKAQELMERFDTEIMETGIAPGLFMLFHKSTWEQVRGFPEHSITFDRDFSARVKNRGMRIALCKGLYVFHLYRYGKNIKDISHLMK